MPHLDHFEASAKVRTVSLEHALPPKLAKILTRPRSMACPTRKIQSEPTLLRCWSFSCCSAPHATSRPQHAGSRILIKYPPLKPSQPNAPTYYLYLCPCRGCCRPRSTNNKGAGSRPTHHVRVSQKMKYLSVAITDSSLSVAITDSSLSSAMGTIDRLNRRYFSRKSSPTTPLSFCATSSLWQYI